MPSKIIDAIPKAFPDTSEAASKTKSIIENTITIVLAHLFALNKAQAIKNEIAAKIPKTAASMPPIAPMKSPMPGIIPDIIFPIIPENAPKNIAAIAKKIPEIISSIPKTVMPVGLRISGLSHVPRCTIVLFMGANSGLPHTGQKFSLDVTSLPQFEQNPNATLCSKLDKKELDS